MLENTDIVSDVETVSADHIEEVESVEIATPNLNSEDHEPQDRKKKISNRIQNLVYENRQKDKALLIEQKKSAELQAQLLTIENEKLKDKLKSAYIEGDSDSIVDIQDKLAENKAKSAIMASAPQVQVQSGEVTGEQMINYFTDKFPWFQNNTQMTEEAKRLDEQLSADPDWQDSSWKSRLSAVGKMIESKYSTGRIAPATDGVKSGTASTKTLYSQSEWATFVKMNPGERNLEKLRDRLNKIKKDQQRGNR